MDESKIENCLKGLNGWQVADNRLQKEFKFGSYLQGLEFVNTIADLAEKHDHHPDIELGYRRVKITLISHDSGQITDRDFKLANQIDKITR